MVSVFSDVMFEHLHNMLCQKMRKKIAVFLFMARAKNTRDVATERQHALFSIGGLSCPQVQSWDLFSP